MYGGHFHPLFFCTYYSKCTLILALSLIPQGHDQAAVIIHITDLPDIEKQNGKTSKEKVKKTERWNREAE